MAWRHDVLDVAWVPGSFEIPLVARKLAASGRYTAVVCLGCVIRGETAHFDHVAGQAAAGVMQAALSTGVPVIFGILTTDSVEQALEPCRLERGKQRGRCRAWPRSKWLTCFPGCRNEPAIISSSIVLSLASNLAVLLDRVADEKADRMTTKQLLPQAFWFRMATPCLHVAEIPRPN